MNCIFFLFLIIFQTRLARMVKLVDTLASGASKSNLVGVQLSFRANANYLHYKELHNIKSSRVSKM